MTTPMYTDKEYLHERFTRLEGMIEDVRGDVIEVKKDVKQLQSDVTSNRLEQVKAGTFATFVAAMSVAVSEFIRRSHG